MIVWLCWCVSVCMRVCLFVNVCVCVCVCADGRTQCCRLNGRWSLRASCTGQGTPGGMRDGRLV